CRSLGLTGDTPVSMSTRPFWEALGLVYVACPSGALLTSPRRLQSLRIHGPADTLELDGAIREAIEHGRDTSAACYLRVAWLSRPTDERIGMPRAGNSSAESTEPTHWELRGDTGGIDGIYVVDLNVLRLVGCVLAALGGLVLWRLARMASPALSFRTAVLLLA